MKKTAIPSAVSAQDAQRAQGLAVVQQIIEAGQQHDALWIAESLYLNAEKARKGSFAAGAVPLFEAAIAWFTQLQRNQQVAACRCNLGLCFKNLGQHDRAIEQFELSLAIDRANNDLAGQSMTLTNIGLCHDACSRYTLALDYYQQSLAIDEQLGDQSGIAYTQNNMGMTLSTLGDYDRAIATLEAAVATYEALQLTENLPNPLINLGNVLNRTGAHQRALAVFERVRTLAQDRPFLLAKVYNGIGSALMGQSDLRNAISFYHAALSIYEQLGHEEGMSRSMGMLADASFTFGDLDNALHFYAEKERLDQQSGNAHGVAIAQHGQAKVYAKQRAFEPAITLYEQAHALNRVIGDRDFEQTICINLATTYAEMRHTKAARLLYQKARRLNRTIKSDTAAMLYHIGMADLCLMEEKLRSARFHARAAYAVAGRTGAIRTQIWALRHLSVGWLHPTTLHKAYRYGQQALDMAETYLESVFDEDFSLSQRSDFSDLYTYMAVLSYERQQYRTSFRIMEMAKARVLHRQMALRMPLQPTVTTAEMEYLHQRERTLVEQIHQLQARQRNEGFTAENMRDLNQYSDELKAVLHQIQQHDPAYHAIRTAVPLHYEGVKKLLG